MSLTIRSRAGDIFEEQEVGCRPEDDTGQRSLGDGEIGLVPEADVRDVPRENLLDLAEQPLPLLVILRHARSIDQIVDLRVVEVTAIEARRRELLRVEHAADDV